MRIGSPATYECRASARAGMHRWRRLPEGVDRDAWFRDPKAQAQCTFCQLVVIGTDAHDCFCGAETPLGQLRLGAGLLDSKDDRDDD